MAQLSNQTDLMTDTHPTTSPAASSRAAGLSANQKKMLGISAATVLLGGVAGVLFATSKNPPSPVENPLPMDGSTPIDNAQPVTLPPNIDVAGKITDSMSFEQAFGEARQEVGVGGVFSWHGHWYNTFEKEEWAGLSLAQRQDYTEMVTGEKLPVRIHTSQPVVSHTEPPTAPQTEPTIIEGHLNGTRVIGLDFDQDGIIDTVVMDGPDGHTYRVVDATGDEGLDTIYRYDSLDSQVTGVIVLDHPFVLSNDDFSQNLENTMSRDVVESILEEPAGPVPANDATGQLTVGEDPETDQDPTDNNLISHDPDDTYVNNGDVADMEQ